MDNLRPQYRYPITSLNTPPKIEKAIDVMDEYIRRYIGCIDIINANIAFLNTLKEYIQINDILLNSKTKGKDELRSRIVNQLVELNIYTQDEARWLRYYVYFDIFIQMLQNSDAVSDILSSKECSLIR